MITATTTTTSTTTDNSSGSSNCNNITSVLRIGPSSCDEGSAAHRLKEALVRYFQSSSNNNNNNADDGNDDDGEASATATATETNTTRTESSTLALENKYFSAQVELMDIIMDGTSDNSSSRNNNKNTPSFLKEDGIVLVFDGHTDNSNSNTIFDSLAAIHTHAEQNDKCGELLRLCVCVMDPTILQQQQSNSINEKEYSRRILWCLDRGYEYVPADLSIEAQQKGHDQRDKDGFARIVEAVQGTVWSSAVMKKKKNNNNNNENSIQQKRLEQAKRELIQETKQNKDNENDTVNENKNVYEPPSDPSILSSAKPISVPNDNRNENNDNKHNHATSTTITADNFNDDDDDDDPHAAEHVFDKMEALLRQANEIRAASQNGTLTDQERRERAGEAALALVNLMGAFDDDDNDNDNQSDDDYDNESDDDDDDNNDK
ncbi:alpha and gamma adaptin binding protein p34 [Nitzschia inconspicua]|uniref:Alpha and gamma adaptin binding protein p34 n=1 Tax=Nitzschia inconspicua TaxID=303405 RepID=A0A9K3PEM4_9STRA|nr:alpha and gamma adaptin binding protein p34 [Nitzschia inconspicua]